MVNDGGLKRNRKAASCTPCRTRRVRCDRALPCSSCVESGRECVWDAERALGPLFERASAGSGAISRAREANETERLRSEIDRLQAIVDVLVSHSAAPPLTHLPTAPPTPAPPAPSPASVPPPPSPLSHRQPPTEASPEAQQAAPPEPPFNADEDLASRLSRLTIKTFELVDPRLEEPSEHGLVKAAQQLLNTAAPTPSAAFSTASESNDRLFLSSSTSKLGLQELVGRVPPKELVDEAVNGYFGAITWLFHPITRAQYDHHATLVFAAKSANGPAPALSLATVFSVCALGLFTRGLSTPAYSEYRDASLAVTLIDLARAALAQSSYIDRPTLDSVRVLVLISAHYVLGAPGDHGARGVALLAVAANSCLLLNLHRDPDDRNNTLSIAQKEDRRRLFWHVFMHENLLTTILGRRFSVLRARDTTTRLPSNLRDDQLLEDAPLPSADETVMTSLIVRMKFARLSDEITEELHGTEPVSYARILALHQKIREQLPQDYKPGGATAPLAAAKTAMIQFRIMSELLRLHRPYLARSYVDPKYIVSRTTCVVMAHQTLKLHTTAVWTGSWAFVMYGSVSSATVLCIDLLYDPETKDREEKKQLVRAAIERLERFRTTSTICRRGATLLRFLLDKIDAPSRSFRPTEEHPPLLKRSRADASSINANPPCPSPPELETELAHKAPSTLSTSAASVSTTSQTPLPSSLSTPAADRPTVSRASLGPSASNLNSVSPSSLDLRLNVSSRSASPHSSLSGTTTVPVDAPATPAKAAIASLDFPTLLGASSDAVLPFGAGERAALSSHVLAESVARGAVAGVGGEEEGGGRPAARGAENCTVS
ncbi:hypothetical protein JCM6882_000778 [Rhodosporidiobolus microsporus]